MTDVSMRIAAALAALDGLGFGIPCILVMRSLASGKGVLIFMGFPTYGNGPFERVLGLKSSVALLGVFLAVCALELVAAALLWQGSRAGATLALALVPIGAVFWWGFALPIPPLLALARSVLVVRAWSALG
ncbi:MAG TPA: hypothetical protein VM370_09295 [Candidatus Thermoplasmatota archaeon]|nr:hypothetical protein [Candidatus Thermoplasmatota archaeon]